MVETGVSSRRLPDQPVEAWQAISCATASGGGHPGLLPDAARLQRRFEEMTLCAPRVRSGCRGSWRWRLCMPSPPRSRRRCAPPAAVPAGPRRSSALAAGGGWRGRSRCWGRGRRGSTGPGPRRPHEGVARNLVAALKFRRLLPVADLMADRIQWLAPAHMLSGAIVPVPPAPSRLRRRGFDPAGELAAALAERLGSPLEACLARRGGRRQVGRRRAERLGQPPRIHATGMRSPQRPPGRRRAHDRGDDERLRAGPAGGRGRPRGRRDLRPAPLSLAF